MRRNDRILRSRWDDEVPGGVAREMPVRSLFVVAFPCARRLQFWDEASVDDVFEVREKAANLFDGRFDAFAVPSAIDIVGSVLGIDMDEGRFG